MPLDSFVYSTSFQMREGGKQDLPPSFPAKDLHPTIAGMGSMVRSEAEAQ
jgi:hypothetical protein